MATQSPDACPQCGASLDAGAGRCAQCGWSPARRPGAGRILLAVVLLLTALGMAMLGGTCAILGTQRSTDLTSLNFGLALLVVAGTIVYAAVALLRRRV